MDLKAAALIFATAVSVWTVYKEAYLDRSRLVLRWQLRSDEHGANLAMTVYNRGRRAVRLDAVTLRVTAGFERGFDWSANLPVDLAEGHSVVLRHSVPIDDWTAEGPTYSRKARFYARDGAGRIHPLRERYRQAVEDWRHERAFEKWMEQAGTWETVESPDHERHGNRSEGEDRA